MIRRGIILLVLVGACGLIPARAHAQSFGIGPRLSVVSSALTANGVAATPPTKFIGGTMRMVTGKHTAFEASMDYRSYTDSTGTSRTRETPIQGSILLFPVKAMFAPYVGGGIGIYSQLHDTLGPAGSVQSTTTERKFGIHLGGGAEIRLAKHAAIFADYRFRFVRFGQPLLGDTPVTVPGGGLVPGLSNLHINHEGSMWTSGMAFYF